MRLLKIAAVIIVAVILQTSFMPKAWDRLVFVDLSLIVVVYFALQRDIVQALLIGAITGFAVDAMGGGLLGAGSFSKTVIAYLIAALASRVNLDNPLARIPILAGAALLDACVYVLLHRLLGQPSLIPFVETTSFKIIATTIAGTILIYLLDTLFSERASQRRQLAFRRRVARRTSGSIRRK